MPTEHELLKQYRGALEKAALWQHKADGFRVMLEGLKMVQGDDLAKPVPNEAEVVEELEGPLSTPDAILRVMRQMPHRAWTPHEVWKRLAQHGWGPVNAAHPVQTVGATMSRMYRRGELTRSEKGVYGLPALTTGGT